MKDERRASLLVEVSSHIVDLKVTRLRLNETINRLERLEKELQDAPDEDQG